MNQIDNARVIALNLAVTALNADRIPADAVIPTAGTYLAFLNAGNVCDVTSDTPAAQETAPAAPAKRGPGRPSKQAEKAEKAEKPAPVAPAQSEEALVQRATETAAAAAAEEAPKATKQDISAAVASLLEANKRAEAIKLLGSFGANSVSGLKESDYAAFLEGAKALLATDDLTA